MEWIDRIDLDGRWELAFCPDAQYHAFGAEPTRWAQLIGLGLSPIPATVPGNVEPDLVAAGLMDDPLTYGRIRQTFAHEGDHYWYHRTFTYQGEVDGRYLLLEGMDTYGTVYLNGACIGTGENMLIAQHMAATSLRCGENELLIHLRPTVLEARRRGSSTAAGTMLDYGYDGAWVRKAPYMFGWDIMPRLVSAGLWRSVALVRKKPVGFLQHYLYTTQLYGDRADLTLFYELALDDLLYGDLSVRITLREEGHVCACVQKNVWGKAGHLRFSLDRPRLWWPRGYGEAFLYEVTAELLHGDRVLDSERFFAGIRTAKLHYRPHTGEEDGEFRLTVNGRPVFVLGTNWVPLHAYPSRQEERVERAVQLAVDVGCNTVRCWGGNVYESETFYRACDRAGLLVWQDFSFACGAYPQQERFLSLVEEEIRSVVREKRQHPCLCLWAGGNECDAAYLPFGSPENDRISREVVPRVLWQEDPVRSYLPCSPYLDPATCAQGQELAVEQHLWGERRGFDGPYYTSSPAQFASEIGYHGCPSPDSVDRFIEAAHRFPCEGDEQWILHGSSPEVCGGPFTYRISLMCAQVRDLTGEQPDDLERFALYSQISQAEALKRFVEAFRTAMPRKSGIIWWNLIDGCPQISDAVVDHYFVKKLAYRYLRTAQQPVLLAVRRTAEGFALFGVNDTDDEVPISYAVDDAGSLAALCGGRCRLPVRGLVRVCLLPQTSAAMVRIRWTRPGAPAGSNHAYIGQYPLDIRRYVREADGLGLLQLEGFSAADPVARVLAGDDACAMPR